MTLQATAERTTGAKTETDWVGRARELAPLIESQAEAGEEGHTLSAVVVEALRESGLFWMLAPEEFGGGADPVTALEVIEEITRADGAAGWCFMVHSVGPVIASVNVEADTIAEFYGGEDRAVTAGFGGPNGTARPVEGGYIVRSARMPFGSGTLNASRVICGLKLLDEAGEPVLLENGSPDIRFAYVSSEKIVFHGNWDVVGLSGSGSVEYELPEQFIEAKYVTTRDADVKRHDPVTAFGEYGITFLGHSGVALGAMKRALEELTRIVDGKRRGFVPVPVGEYSVFLYEFSRHEALYQAARAFAVDTVARAWESALTTGSVTQLQLARLRQVSSWLHVVAGEIIDFAFLWAGSEPIRRTSALGRVARDVRVARNHYVVDPSSFEEVGIPIAASWRAGTESAAAATGAVWPTAPEPAASDQH